MEQLDFKGRVAIVTGAGRGMGRSHALMLASRGARVVVNDLPGNDGRSLADDVVGEIEAAGGTAVADHNSVLGGCDDIVAAAIAAFGRLDILVANAGVMSSYTLAEQDRDDWNRVFDVHFRGTVDLCRAAWPYLVESGSGRIITISSSGMLGNIGLTSYGAAKGGIFSFTRSLAMEGAEHGINANCLLPTAATRMTDTITDEAFSLTLGRLFQPEHVSALVVWLAHQDTVVSNEAFQVSGGRAGRVMMAAGPTVRVDESSPERWAAQTSALLQDGALAPLLTTAALFQDELFDADPMLKTRMGQASEALSFALTSDQDA